jgi:uncharacterized SAM-binding protein YcdF (DUF218 family)
MACNPDAIIIIFGAAVRRDGRPSAVLRARVSAAAAFGQGFKRPLFIPTGGQGRFGPPEAHVMRDLLLAAGVPPDRIAVEATARDTLESVRAVRRMLRARGYEGTTYIATSAYHQPRCVLLCRLAGIRAARATPPPVPASTRFWRRWYWRLRELPAVPYDAALVLGLRLLGRL